MRKNAATAAATPETIPAIIPTFTFDSLSVSSTPIFTSMEDAEKAFECENLFDEVKLNDDENSSEKVNCVKTSELVNALELVNTAESYEKILCLF